MCGGLIFKTNKNEQFITAYFPRPYTKIYGVNRELKIIEAYWGKRDEIEFKDINMPKTGWARIESLEKGFWNKFEYTKVLIPAYKYMEKDKTGHSHWFMLNENEFIEAILIVKENLNFIYIVTVPSTEEYSKIHNRWVSVVYLDNYKKIIYLDK